MGALWERGYHFLGVPGNSLDKINSSHLNMGSKLILIHPSTSRNPGPATFCQDFLDPSKNLCSKTPELREVVGCLGQNVYI